MSMKSDNKIFLDAMSDVEPLKVTERITGNTGKKSDNSGLAQRRRAAAELKGEEETNPLTLGDVPQLEPNTFLEWKQDGVQNAVFSKLKSGKYPIHGVLDLHRKTVKEAREDVYAFFLQASEKGWRNLLILHGRGEKSRMPARIKSYVAAWLLESDHVLAYSSANRHHGGSGAVYVMVRKSPKFKRENREYFGN